MILVSSDTHSATLASLTWEAVTVIHTSRPLAREGHHTAICIGGVLERLAESENWRVVVNDGTFAYFTTTDVHSVLDQGSGRAFKDGSRAVIFLDFEMVADTLHSRDRHCLAAGSVDPETLECALCGAGGGGECHRCSGVRFHKPGCPESDATARQVELVAAVAEALGLDPESIGPEAAAKACAVVGRHGAAVRR